MVKVINPVNPEIGTPTTGLQGLNVRFSPDSYGAQVGASISRLGATLQESAEKDQRFNTLTNFSNFETQSKMNLQKMQKSTPTNDGNFFDRAMSDYDNASQAFLNDVPAPLQKEFEFRAAQLKQGIALDAYQFAFKQKGLYYNQHIDDATTQAGVAVTADPNQLGAKQASIHDYIDSTDLPEIEKEKQKRLVDQNLAALSYRTKIKTIHAEELRAPPSADAAGILQHEEGFRPTPYWDVNHYRVGYGSDTITKADGSFEEVKQGMTVTKADAERDLTRRVGLLSQDAAGKVGASTWAALPEPTKAAVLSVGYNYGHIPGSVVDALKTGDQEQIASAVEKLSSNKDRRAREAAIIRGGAVPSAARQSIDNDPSYSMLSAEDRTSLSRDGEREAQSDWTEQLRAHKAQTEATLNDLYVGLHDGTKGQVDIDNLRKKGTLIDYEDIARADNILKERDKGLADFNYGQQKLTAGGLWDKSSEDDKKGANALFGAAGQQAIEKQDENYVQQTLLPRYAKMEMAAPNMASLLVAQSNLSDPKSASFALDTMRRMREQAPEAFNAQFPESIQKAVDQWSVRRNFESPEDLIGQIQGRGLDPAQRQAQDQLRTQVKKDINDPSSENFINLSTAMRSYQSRIPFTSPDAPLSPTAQTEFVSDYRALVEDNFVKSGNLDTAKQLADKAIQRVWAPTSVGGAMRIMKFPPEVAGYQSMNGSFDWINNSVRAQLPAVKDRNFELLADATTESEIAQHKTQSVDPHFHAVEEPTPAQNFQRNSQWVKPGALNFNTQLSTEDETKFRAWVQQNKVPFDPNALGPQDYDMRGFWQGMTTGDPHAKTGVDANDGKLHYTDYWKTPYHQTFSNESKFATANAPHWTDDDKLVSSKGQVLYDDRAPKGGVVKPSYLVTYQDDNGLFRIAGDDKGVPQRVDFEPTAEDTKAAEDDFRAKQDEASKTYIRSRYYGAKVLANNGGPPVPPAVEAEFNRLNNQEIEDTTSDYKKNILDITVPIAKRLKDAQK